MAKRMFPAGMYVLRIPNPHYSQVKSAACWYAWAKPLQEAGVLDMLTAPYEYADVTDMGIVDQGKIVAAVALAASRGVADTAPYGLNKQARDGNVYQAFAVIEPVEAWPESCQLVAWKWDGDQDLELAAGGVQVKPYTEVDAATDAVKQTAEKAAEVAAEFPAAASAALDQAADVLPWWAKLGAGVLAVVGVGYAVRSFRGGK